MPESLIEFRINIDDTYAFIKTDSNKAANMALKTIRNNRIELEKYILKHPDFFKSLKPIKISKKSPEIIKRMASAAKSTGVGPMAAVAGAISDLAVDSMIKEGARVAVVENGGEIFANSNRELNIAIISGSSSISGKFGLRVVPDDMPLGICTSSTTLSHALTFGEADAVTIIAENAALGDAASTSICNEVKGNNVKDSIKRALELTKKIKGVMGGIIIQGQYIGTIGKIPQIISIEGLEKSHLITI